MRLTQEQRQSLVDALVAHEMEWDKLGDGTLLDWVLREGFFGFNEHADIDLLDVASAAAESSDVVSEVLKTIPEEIIDFLDRGNA